MSPLLCLDTRVSHPDQTFRAITKGSFCQSIGGNLPNLVHISNGLRMLNGVSPLAARMACIVFESPLPPRPTAVHATPSWGTSVIDFVNRFRSTTCLSVPFESLYLLLLLAMTHSDSEETGTRTEIVGQSKRERGLCVRCVRALPASAASAQFPRFRVLMVLRCPD